MPAAELDHPNTNILPNVKLVNPKALKFAKYNPPNRTKKENLKDMIESLSKYGQLTPVIIRSNNVIVMGHRRTAAARALGWTSIQAVVRDDLDADVMFAEDMGTTKKFNGNDALGIWLENPKAIPGYLSVRFQNMETKIGRVLVKRIHREGLSIRAYNLAKQIGRYCGDETDKFLGKTVVWLMESGSMGVIGKALAYGVNSVELKRAIQANQPIKIKMAIQS